MKKERHNELKTLFKAITGKSVIAVPKIGEPSSGYCTAKNTERYYR